VTSKDTPVEITANWIENRVAARHLEPTPFEPITLGDSLGIHDLERYAANRYRERYSMKTTALASFIAYVNQGIKDAGTESVIVSIDPDTCSALAILNARDDAGLPGHCDNVASCVLRSSPVWKYLIGLGEAESMVLDQREAIDTIADWNEHVTDAAKVVGAFQKMTIESVSKRGSEKTEFSDEQTAMQRIDLKSQDGDIPSDIVFTLTPYDGFSERVVTVGCSANLDRHDDIALKWRVRSFETLRESIANEFAGLLSEGLGVTPVIGVVTPAK